MAINHEFVGRQYPRTAPYQVSRAKISEFARAVGSTNPACFQLEAARGCGFSDLVAPSTFAVIVAQQAEAQYIEDPDARVDFSRVVHADERMTYSRPIVAGDDLVTELYVDKIVERGALAMVTTRCEVFSVPHQGTPDVTDGAGEHVVTVVSTLAIRGEDA
ncbi:FAS1-like dehydratase domain-containing protein [Jonesia denitrificans]|uniref:UPF0336 protein Jden_0562 n=1 Tax=Jonesia denitrificans (strain ATCC 14870 / DSM 20603 / BCRC 15368 / CIP 55.134 / JCM 11481 / NBRC 15587 / NCTC 10816 / Prevot 55134) TaxID=471856 RepID=C7R0R9_JONDD|nr:MaoC family dehydratase N-terminal domain-containing protein [Jonesia denitrificans]ACV08226.1 hypothetical protein Jden_0562 [Jonesia denitrificans DSM 20603]ASE08103.1 hypothetical protein CEP80_02375 [Jonesia denitrificans]QXB42706.1 MaoC family dehydratase N-terminal domain-containing protein [Jonesia denitrificans]SQH20207.1 (3R)-hydroxyacyl-ACP dehydratase subunit HadA [Jonesia denitrificans]